MKSEKRPSHWHVVRRCLSIVRCVQREPASQAELIAAVQAQEGDDAYGQVEGRALERRFENDLHHLRDSLDIPVRFDRQVQGYVILEGGRPLLDVPDQDIATIAWLEETFGPQTPQHDQVNALLQRLRAYLSPERRAEIERCRVALSVDLAQRDDDQIDPQVWEHLTKALIERRRVELHYLSPQQADAEPRRHVVDPYERFFDTVRGHYYLRGWCHYTDGPLGRVQQAKYFNYRIGRIVQVQVLPNRLPPSIPSAPTYEVVYTLAPRVARLGVTRHKPIQVSQVEEQPDGSALVRGSTQDIFAAARALLHYGAGCVVLGGPELRREIKHIVQDMAQLYQDPTPTT